jgi:hypothetical protein
LHVTVEEAENGFEKGWFVRLEKTT